VALAVRLGLSHRVEPGAGDDRGRGPEQRRGRMDVEVLAARPGHTHRVPGARSQRAERPHFVLRPGMHDQSRPRRVVARRRGWIDERERDHPRARGHEGRALVAAERLDHERCVDPW